MAACPLPDYGFGWLIEELFLRWMAWRYPLGLPRVCWMAWRYPLGHLKRNS
jgi:hypothetical protein